MLARKYNYAESWEQESQRQREMPRVVRQHPSVRPRVKSGARVLFYQVSVLAVSLLLSYAMMVGMSQMVVNASNQLIELQGQEAQLISRNAVLKIEVDQLKGPERITAIATQQLGMSVARNNIYVRAGKN